MEKTLVVWRRLGKEHGENCGYKVNTQDIIDKHIKDKISTFSNTPMESWRWWRVDEKLIIETETIDKNNFKKYYYFLHKNWLIVENFNECGWEWYIHIGKLVYSKEHNSWIFTDWFSDVVVKSDKLTHSVLDLDELGNALELGLIDSEQLVEILKSTQELIDLIRAGDFPPKEIKKYLKTDKGTGTLSGNA